MCERSTGPAFISSLARVYQLSRTRGHAIGQRPTSTNSERGSGTSQSAASSAQPKNPSRHPKVGAPALSAGTESLAFYTGHQAESALQKTQIHWPLHQHTFDQPSHLPATVTFTSQNSPCISCLTPQTLSLTCLFPLQSLA